MVNTRIFYVTDIHGSERCFKKFINAGPFYKAQILIMGGDITGKMVIPIVEQGDGTYIAQLVDRDRPVKNKEELEYIEKIIRDSGFYPYRVTKDEIEELQNDKAKIDQLFSRLMCESLERWISIAEERLKGKGVDRYIIPGNDDRFEIDDILRKSKLLMYPEGRVIELDRFHEMISTGFANMTPWKCPRDIEEEELADKIQKMVSQVRDMKNCIFNFHCPPYNTPIDAAPKLDENLTPLLAPGGDLIMTPAGSTSVRTAIEENQPLLGLHGHIHESKGMIRLGRTLCINPGSEYGEGILRGVIVDLSKKKIEDYLFTSG
ncbi:MAG: metallophosphoesterase [Candidatus Heimdallarchaeota archaeon]